MSLATQVTALATRIATEIKAVRVEIAGRAPTSHTHAAANVNSGVLDQARVPNVTSAPYTQTFGSIITIDASLGNNVKVTATSNPTFNVPTNPTDGQMLMIAVLASGASRTVSFQTAGVGSPIQLTTGLTASYVITSGKVGFFGLRYSQLSGNWTLLAQTTEL